MWTGEVVENGFDSDNEGAFYNRLNFTWNFDWEDLMAQGVVALFGYIIVKSHSHNFPPKKIDIAFTEGMEKVSTIVQANFDPVPTVFEYHLTAHYAENEQVSYEEMFAASDKTDGVLVVEGKKLHVNKAFLSFHSDFFTALFSSNFKEGQLTEIPIEDVSYEDFALLLSTIYPETVFPNDSTLEKLLELADRFLMRAVIRQIEHHLVYISKLGFEKVLWMAEKYGMPELLAKTIRSIDTVEKAKKLEKFPQYDELSGDTKGAIFKRLLKMI